MIRRCFRYLFSTPPANVTIGRDAYNSLLLNLNSKVDPESFMPYLKSLIAKEKANPSQPRANAFWIHLDSHNFTIAQQLCQELQFKIHHGKDDKLVLYRWIAEMEDMVTPYSMFYISCGSVILKDEHVLLVQEKLGPRKGEYGVPGGRVDFGECIPECAERELFEEVGIRAKYHYILHFRELTETLFHANDLFFACMMQYQPSALKDLKICQNQLCDYKWVHLRDYGKFAADNSFGTQHQLGTYIHKLYLEGYDFNTCPNKTNSREYTSPRDNITRRVVEHVLID